MTPVTAGAVGDDVEVAVGALHRRAQPDTPVEHGDGTLDQTGPAALSRMTSSRWPTSGLPSRHATTSAPSHAFHCAPERKVPPDGATVTPPETHTGVIVAAGSSAGFVIGFDWS